MSAYLCLSVCLPARAPALSVHSKARAQHASTPPCVPQQHPLKRRGTTSRYPLPLISSIIIIALLFAPRDGRMVGVTGYTNPPPPLPGARAR
ncbi:hypothetical protein EDC01DRAFT_642753, partial [Geopyxis carbonaria]